MSDFIELALQGKNGEGKVAKISPEDWEWAKEHRWVFNPTSKDRGYAVTWIKSKRHYMHRMVCEGETVDHINRDTLDNRRENLRACTSIENARNAKACDGKSSVYKGVYRRKSKTPGYESWRAELRDDGIRKRIGTFRSEIEAAQAYDAEARARFGEFAFLNFPDVDGPIVSEKQAERTRNSIAEAIQAFVEQGRPNVTNVEIAKAVGVTETAIRRHREALRQSGRLGGLNEPQTPAVRRRRTEAAIDVALLKLAEQGIHNPSFVQIAEAAELPATTVGRSVRRRQLATGVPH